MSDYAGASVLITGGLGFLGSSLALRLLREGATVTVVDNRLAGHGANDANLAEAAGRVEVVEGDVRDLPLMTRLAARADRVFHLAAQVDHGRSVREPFLDLGVNAQGTLTVLEAARAASTRPWVITTGTRAEYGPAAALPVREDAPTNPQGCYAVSKLAATRYAVTYRAVHGVPTVAARLTNVYGARGQMRHDGFGVANWFLRRALDREPIRIFGEGQIRRDYVYVDDAIDALLGLGRCEALLGQIVNVGGAAMHTLVELAEAAIAGAGGGAIEYVPYPPGKLALEPGDFCADIQRISAAIGWRPAVDLREGMRRAAGYYRERQALYWP